MSDPTLKVERALLLGERLVHDNLQGGLIELLATMPAGERYAAMSGVMCRVTSLAVVLVGQEDTRRVLATSIKAAPHAPASAVAAAQALRDAIDTVNAPKRGVH